MKQKSFLLVFACALAISGCSGLAMWQKGHFYHSEVADSSAVSNVHSVGVYVFSDGESEHKSKYNLGFIPGDWPGAEVAKGSTFSPDSSNSGPSLEFANALVKELNERGYNAKAVTDLGHSHEVTLDQCLENAKKAGYDGAFVAYYKGYTSWNTSDVGRRTYGSNVNVINITIREGFLYLAHGGFFDAKSDQQLWKNSYYGLVENAHMFNLSDEPFVKVISDAVVDNGAEDYMKAAPIAATVLLAPKRWAETTKPFPSIGEKRHRM